MRRLALLAAFAGILGTALSAPPALSAPGGRRPPRNVPVARPPALRPGDCWQYRNLNIRIGTQETVRCVVKVVNDGYVMQTQGRVSGLARYDRNLVWLGSIGADRTIRQPARSEVPLRLQFPLWVGRNWGDSYRTIDIETGGFYPVNNLYIVEALEEIEVPAGRFMAFRVKRIRTNLANNEAAVGTTWYAPAVRNIVRVQNAWKGGTRMILSAFQLAGGRASETTPGGGKPPAALMRASHILVRDAATAREVLRRLRAGEAFDALAREFSVDPSRRFGGDIGTFKKGEILPELEEAVRGLKVGEVAGPVKSELGYHIVKRTG